MISALTSFWRRQKEKGRRREPELVGTVLWRPSKRVLFLLDTERGRCPPPRAFCTMQPGSRLRNWLKGHAALTPGNCEPRETLSPGFLSCLQRGKRQQKVLTEAGEAFRWLGSPTRTEPWLPPSICVTLSNFLEFSEVIWPKCPLRELLLVLNETACGGKSRQALASLGWYWKHLLQPCPAQPGT